jgi:8-oxo-dGTP diphosphatase
MVIRMGNKDFFVCVEGVYIEEDKMLLLKRNSIPFKGYWHLVGGQVENNETLKEALRREFKEETNLDIEVGSIIDGRLEETFDRIKIIVTFEVITARGKIKLNSEHEKYEWFLRTPSNSICNYDKYLRKNIEG